VQYLLLALRQHGEVELPLDRLELRDSIQELLNPVQINSCGDPPERLVTLRVAQGGDKIKIRDLHTVFFNGRGWEHIDAPINLFLRMQHLRHVRQIQLRIEAGTAVIDRRDLHA
ncbi:MazG-like family, partial [Dysosmobacter welbionis]